MYLVKSLPTGTGKIETTFCKDSSVLHQRLTTITFGWDLVDLVHAGKLSDLIYMYRIPWSDARHSSY